MQRKLNLQHLEARTVMSNVAVDVVAGDLILTGDNGNSDIEIRQIDADSYRVIAKNGSGINGGYAPWWSGSFHVDFHGVTDDVRISMNGGNDKISLGTSNQVTSVRDDLVVNLGSGHDILNFHQVSAGDDFWLNGGSGHDRIIDWGSRTGTRTNHGDMALDAFEDMDIFNTVVDRDLSVNNETSSGTVAFSTSGVLVGDDLRISTGSGRDYIDIINTHVADDTVLSTGDEPWSTFGGDLIMLSQSTTGDRLEVEAGSGNDILKLQNFDGARAYLYGEGGSDELDMDAASSFSGTFVNAF